MDTRSHRVLPIVALTTLLIVVAFAPGWAENNGKHQNGEGKYANLTALWEVWAFSQPAVDIEGTNTNPVLDSTGAFAAAGQENGIGPGNKYFFLAGTFGGTAVRTVTVPAGKALFFPVIAGNWDNAVDPPPPTPYTVPELRAQAKASADSITAVSATLNGEPLEVFRTKSPVFDYTLPSENSLYEYFGLVGPQFEGRVNPSVADGYWVFIPPLPAGDYTLAFAGANSSGFNVNVTYYLTIE